MIYVTDTHPLVFWASKRSERLGKRARRIFQEVEQGKHSIIVPVAVLDVAPGLDGILGMNLWDSATQMVYDPFGGPTLSVAFRSQPVVITGDTGSINTILAGQGLGSIGGADHGNNLPGVVLHNGQITGEIYRDYNANGVINPGEQGIPNQIVYLDLNHTGNFGLGDPSAVTDQNGVYHFSLLAPGSYAVRQYPGPGLAVVTPASGSITVQVQDNTAVSGVNFGDVATQGTVTAGFVGDLYGQIFDRPPDASG